jgi:hypothetical protein
MTPTIEIIKKDNLEGSPISENVKFNLDAELARLFLNTESNLDL